VGEYLNFSIPLSIGLSALLGEYGEWFFKFAIKILPYKAIQMVCFGKETLWPTKRNRNHIQPK